MRTRARPTATATTVVLALTAGAVATALAVPALRTGLAVTASWVSVLLVVAGLRRHRPANRAPWLALTVMLLTWALASTGGALAVDDALVRPVMLLGQVLGCLTVAHVGLGLVRGLGTTPEARSDALSSVVLVAATLVLVVVQLTTAGDMSTGYVVAVGVDITLLGVVVRFTVARTGLRPASLLLLGGGTLAILYDLTTALHGERLAPGGSLAQVLGSACVLVLGAAALHPTMRTSFTPQDFEARRPASLALLGLIPLLLSPAVLAVVVAATGHAAPPAWLVASACTVVAALCLLTAARALRATEHLAEHDPLTDLANRRGLVRAHARGAALDSLLLLDVDEFKQVNDTHGHEVGDQLLVEVAARLRTAVGADGTVCRLGGDEFVVLTTAADRDAVADRVVAVFDGPFTVEGRPVLVGASVGSTTSEEPSGDGTPLDVLLTQADIAMYAAKAAGGHRVHRFHPDMRIEVTRRYTLGDEVRRLLAGEHPDVGRLVVHYQPVVDLSTGGTVAAEALVRWCHPVQGLLGPGDFLDLVNGNDLDALLDSAVVRAVATDLQHWRDQGRPVVPVSVNLTRASLDDPDLASRVLGVLARAEVPTSLFRVEITEHEELSGSGPAAASLGTLRDAGVTVMLDDYGTGYTSLDYLRRFPVQVLKLDRSLVRTVDEAEGDAGLLAAVTAMAASLDLAVVAEGVETPAQRDALLALGVGTAQGFLYARPLTSADFAERHLAPRPTPAPAPAPAP